MTAPQDVEIAESLQQQLKFFADTEMVLRSDLEALERKLRRTRLVASLAVASALLLPVVLRFVPLSTKRLVTRELVVETDRGGSLRVGSTETESSLRFQHRDKPGLVITASDQEHRMQLSAFDEKAEGIVLSSRADRTSVSLSHEPQSDGSSNRVVLVSDAEGGRVEARGSAGAAVLGGRVPSVSLSSPGSTLTASADDHAKLELSKRDAGSITLAATDKGPRLSWRGSSWPSCSSLPPTPAYSSRGTDPASSFSRRTTTARGRCSGVATPSTS